jgi:hypothetical protein
MGPAANLVVACLLYGLNNFTVPVFSLLTEPVPLWLFLSTNLAVGLVNLMPFRYPSAKGGIFSDGALLLQVPFMKELALTEWLRAMYYSQCDLAMQKGDGLHCEMAAREGLELFPKDPALISCLGIGWLLQSNVNGAINAFQAIVNHIPSDNVSFPIFQSNLAFAYALRCRNNDMEHADSLSVSAMDRLPWNLSVRYVRGTVLVAMGKVDEGMRLLTDQRYALMSTADQARIACATAMGYAWQGNNMMATSELKKAEEFDSECLMLEPARRVVEKASGTVEF